MNAKARKREKRKAARSVSREQASQIQASKDEAALDDAARGHEDAIDVTGAEAAGGMAMTTAEIHEQAAAWILLLANSKFKSRGENETSDREKTIVVRSMPAMVTCIQDLVRWVREVPEAGDIGTFKIDWKFRTQTEEAMEKAANEAASRGELDGARSAQAATDAAVIDPHRPDPQYMDLWSDVVDQIKSECPDASDKVLHDRAAKMFRIRKKRLKAKVKKGHDQHVVAMKDISNVKK